MVDQAQTNRPKRFFRQSKDTVAALYFCGDFQKWINPLEPVIILPGQKIEQEFSLFIQATELMEQCLRTADGLEVNARIFLRFKHDARMCAKKLIPQLCSEIAKDPEFVSKLILTYIKHWIGRYTITRVYSCLTIRKGWDEAAGFLVHDLSKHLAEWGVIVARDGVWISVKPTEHLHEITKQNLTARMVGKTQASQLAPVLELLSKYLPDPSQIPLALAALNGTANVQSVLVNSAANNSLTPQTQLPSTVNLPLLQPGIYLSGVVSTPPVKPTPAKRSQSGD